MQPNSPRTPEPDQTERLAGLLGPDLALAPTDEVLPANDSDPSQHPTQDYSTAETTTDLVRRRAEEVAPTRPAPPNRRGPQVAASKAARRARSLLQIPGYDILSELGRGGMGVVYRARQHGLNRLVALKMVLGGGHASADQLARFRAEAQAVARLQHRNIVQIYEIGEHDGLPFFSLEFCSGGCLEDKLDGTPWRSRQAALVMETLANAIQVAHQAGIIHRDLKPPNVLLTPSDLAHGLRLGSGARADDGKFYELKITDFGLAKKLDEAGGTQTGAILGTPSYMAPEQASGNIKLLGPATDVYALGAILYELLTGRPPFLASTPLETVFQVVAQDPVPPSQLRPGLDRDLETICLKCLRKEPARRYASAAELAEDLRRYREAEPILARPTPALTRAWKWVRRHKALTGVFALLVLGILAGFGAVFWHDAELQRRVTEAQQGEQRALLDKTLSEAQAALKTAKAAFDDEEWERANAALLILDGTLGSKFDGAPELVALRSERDALRASLQPRLANAARAEEARNQRDRFPMLYHHALTEAFLFDGEDAEDQRRRVAQAAQDALNSFPPEEPAEEWIQKSAFLSKEEKETLSRHCYDLLLLWARVEEKAAAGSPKAKQLRHALELLDRAAQLPVKANQEIHLRRASCLEALGSSDAAERERKAALAATRDGLDAFLEGRRWYLEGNYKRAQTAFEEAAGLDAEHFWPGYFLAVCYLQQHEARLARATLNGVVADGIAGVWVHLLRVEALSELNDFAGAEKEYRTVEQELQKYDDARARYAAHVYRGSMYVRQAQSGGLASSLARQKLDAAVTELQAAIQLQPAGYLAHADLAQAYRQQRAWDAAAQELSEAIARCHQETVLSRLYLERAELRRQQTEHETDNTRSAHEEAALKDYQEVIQREASKDVLLAGAAHVASGNLLRRAGRLREAYDAYEAVSAIQREDGSARHLKEETLPLKAETLLALGRFEEAIETYTGCLALNKVPGWYRDRALAKFQLGRYADAVKDYTEALRKWDEAQPGEANEAARAWRSVALSGRGWAYLADNRLNPARDDFRLAARLDAGNTFAQLGSAYLDVKQAPHDEALAAALSQVNDAVARPTPSPGVLYTAARIYGHAAGRAQRQSRHLQGQAIELLRRSLRALPDDQQRLSFWKNSIQVYDPARKRSYLEPDFKPVADHEEFRVLEQDMEQLNSRLKMKRQP